MIAERIDTNALLKDVVVKRFDQVVLIPSGVSSLGVNQQISCVLQINDEMLLSSSPGPPQEVIYLILLGDIVGLWIRVQRDSSV